MPESEQSKSLDGLGQISDHYIDKDGKLVFTASYLLNRGRCCKSGCRHCPYPKKMNSKHMKSKHD